MLENWRKTTNLLIDAHIDLSNFNININIVRWWWGLIIASWIVSLFTEASIGLMLERNSNTDYSIGAFLSFSIEIAAAVLAIIMVKRFSIIENELYDQQDKVAEAFE